MDWVERTEKFLHLTFQELLNIKFFCFPLFQWVIWENYATKICESVQAKEETTTKRNFVI